MCWPRVFCCRCPGPSSFPGPPALRFGKYPRRPARPPASFIWTPPPNLRFNNNINAQPPDPVIPRTPWDKRRRVRFADDPPVLIEAPPSPCETMVSFTPPMMMTPPAMCPHAHVSPELCSPRGSHPYLDWDITQFPSSARLFTSTHSHTAATLDGPATFPPTHLLTLSFADNPAHLHWECQWGPIFVRAQGLRSITVEDVLDAIYQYFNQPLGPADFATVSPPAWNLISDSYYQRLPRSPNLRAYDVRRGALRLDVLNGATKFSGLQPVGRDYFRLMLSA
ncbi:hypothetical protein DFH07DRAFT_929079 [Mycena maculata]|uniref:DUF6699 domain-containing protein n=1 Tax=Mycena maculata TaxID=230809 RepID=A0AAD7I0E5_9AGAR|nr:hypothetical protein DFH07DRAFT_929079 [Mycena maculata]